ncbi:MAG: M28 family peptidase [Solirubrobacterales bacterium]
MIDLRLYRYALLAVPVVAVIAMFSLQSPPSSVSGGVPPDAFDPASAAPLAKRLAESSAYPTPGSAADNRMADQVRSQFSAIDGATVSEQRFDGSFKGHDVHLRNLIATLPGESNRQIVLIAPRDVAEGSGAVTSAASTAAMLEIADSFSGASHHKTLVFVSTDGSSIGALGAKHFISDYSYAGLLDAAIVLSQPAVQHPRAPLVIPWSSGAQSTASQLDDTANSTVSQEVGTPAGDEGPIADLFRLALPAGLGEQGPLIKSGLPAVRLSSDGELPINPSEDTPERFSTDTFSRFGRSALSLILALDASPGAVQHGPKGYIGVAGNLLPGWTIALLALSLLVPVGLAAGFGLASSARSPAQAARGGLWAALRALPFLGALVVLLATALVGLLPSPDFPFDPRIESLGLGGTIAVVLAVLFYCTVAFFLRPLRSPPPAAASGAAPAALLIAAFATLAVWALNPYLALLVAVGLQAWLWAAAQPPAGRLGAGGLILVGLLPLVALAANLAGRLGAGAGVWHDLVLMLADGQIGTTLALLGCLLAGAGVAIVAAAGTVGGRPRSREPEMQIDRPGEISVRRQDGAGEPEPPDEPESGEDEEPGSSEPAQPEPERDPRLWSKPRGWISPPSGSFSATPSPSET